MDETIFLFDMFVIISPLSTNHHLNVSAAGLLHPDPAGVDYLGVDRKKGSPSTKASHEGAARTKPVKPAVFYWRPLGSCTDRHQTGR